MIWKVKKGICRQVLYRKSSNTAILEAAAYIGEKKGSCTILDKNGKVLFKVGKKGETLISIQSAGGDEQIAEMVLSKNKSLLQPPKADRIILLWNKRTIVLVQSERRSYTFWHNYEKFGGIEGMLKRVVTIHSAEDDSDEMMALLYVLSYIMLHEDDMDIL